MTHGSDAWVRLLEGNRRFAAETPTRTATSEAARAGLLSGQLPLAAVLSCSDSRVPPEIVFDAGVGDLFVVRSAGHVLDPIAQGSLIYAIAHLDVPLVVILGHSDCGAVGEAMRWARGSNDHAEAESEEEAAIRPLVELIAPALAAVGMDSDVDDVARAHVDLTRKQLLSHPCVTHAAGRKAAEVFGAFYDLGSGLVERIS